MRADRGFVAGGRTRLYDDRAWTPGRARDRFWEFPARAPWACRLVQIQLSVVYLSAVWLKLHAPAWLHGTAVSYSARIEDFARYPLPSVLSHSPFFSSALTYWTIAVELMIGILVWNRAARPLVLVLGAALHVTVGLNMELGFFSETMLAIYLAFLIPSFASSCVLGLRDGVDATIARACGRGSRSSGTLSDPDAETFVTRCEREEGSRAHQVPEAGEQSVLRRTPSRDARADLADAAGSQKVSA
jgi:hypothetical protein